MDFFANKWTCAALALSGWPALPQSQLVPPAAASLLAADISDEEIWAAIRDLKPNRSPGRDVLQLFGLPAQFINWVLQCVMHLRFALLLNDKQTLRIEATREFRQGCPLSSYAFILCSELLSCALQLQGHSIGISLSPAGPRISHLLYADDVLLVGAASSTALGAIRSTLEDYCNWTGQCINSSKSMVVFSKAMPSWKADWIARSLGFQRVTEMLYLGV
ncbi:hypothetical protein KSP39_PZI023674 [Platanthera zijinensis]|uniref:Reverse transcriptase domain-containing protein n=1 Tax=Platanthera zijinensis TaxID=2320716 RepID=A0AAP0ATI4_9ASPA